MIFFGNFPLTIIFWHNMFNVNFIEVKGYICFILVPICYFYQNVPN